MFDRKRREFITLLSGAAAAWPLAARAQQPERTRRIAILLNAAADDPRYQPWVGAFLQALALLGWTIGRNVRIDTRWSGANAAETRRRLLAAATEEFAARGIAGARVDRIAAEAGANKSLIYSYFGSKDGLFTAVYDAQVAMTLDAVPFDATDLPGYAGRLFDYHRDFPTVYKLTAWARLEQPGGARLEMAAASADAVPTATSAAMPRDRSRLSRRRRRLLVRQVDCSTAITQTPGVTIAARIAQWLLHGSLRLTWTIRGRSLRKAST